LVATKIPLVATKILLVAMPRRDQWKKNSVGRNKNSVGRDEGRCSGWQFGGDCFMVSNRLNAEGTQRITLNISILYLPCVPLYLNLQNLLT
jgi:hypothetical protein